MSYLVANHEDRFSRDVAHFVLACCVPFPFAVYGGVWNVVVSVPHHCLFIYFAVSTIYSNLVTDMSLVVTVILSDISHKRHL